MRPPTPTISAPAPRRPDRFCFSTDDPERGHAWLRTAYSDHTVSITGSTDGFWLRNVYRPGPGFFLSRLQHSTGVEIDAEPIGEIAVVRNFSRDGRVHRTNDGYRRPAAQHDVFLAAEPQQPFGIGWDRADLEVLQLEPAAVATVARTWAQRSSTPLVFTSLDPTSAAAGRSWGQLVDHVASEVLAHPALLCNPLIAGPTFRMLVLRLLGTFANTLLAPDALDPGRLDQTRRTPPRAVDAAIDFIEGNVERDIGIGDVATACGTSAQALRRSFLETHSTTVGGHIRRVRLGRARHDLLYVDGSRPEQLEAVAARWGFPDQAGFRRQYRFRYGEEPMIRSRE